MIRNLRKKFIIVAMSSTLVVLVAIMTGLNGLNYYRMLKQADEMTEMIANNNGSFKSEPPQKPEDNEDSNQAQDNSYQNNKDLEKAGTNGVSEDKAPDNKFKPKGMSPETPYETRYFSVSLDSDGNCESANLESIAAISEDEAISYAKKTYSGKTTGFINIYRYRVTKTDDGNLIVFIDCRKNISDFKNTLLISVSVSFLGFLAVFILVLLFSKIVFKPVAESYEKQKQFITDAGHEIKTPLTIIDANTEVLEMETGENQWTKSIRNQVKRLTVLTGQLITLAKLDEHDSKLESNKFCISQDMEEAVASFEILAKKKSKKMNPRIQENVYMTGDERAIQQLIGILLDNAIKYSTEGSIINISLLNKGKRVFINVHNDVENIDIGNQDILFERFYRADSSRNSKTGGTGIGLSVAKAIVTSHKGKITAESKDGKSLDIDVVL